MFTPLALIVARQIRLEKRAFPRATLLGIWILLLVGLRLATTYWSTHKNAEEWATAIRDRVPYQVGHIVFVEDMARYGIHLHLGAQIVKVSIEPVAGDRFGPDNDTDLDTELARADDGHTIYIWQLKVWPEVRQGNRSARLPGHCPWRAVSGTDDLRGWRRSETCRSLIPADSAQRSYPHRLQPLEENRIEVAATELLLVVCRMHRRLCGQRDSLGSWRSLALICVAAGLLSGVGIWDLIQSRHTLLRNFPVSGHGRYLMESVRPMLRQYIVESDTEEVPFSHVHRSIVYQRAKNIEDARPFGTELPVYANNYEWINHSMAPAKIASADFRIDIGGDNCTKPYSASVFNISAMSFGSLSANAIRALNEGARARQFLSRHRRRLAVAVSQGDGGDVCLGDRLGLFRLPQNDGIFNDRQVCRDARSSIRSR